MHKYSTKLLSFLTFASIFAGCNETSFQADAPQRASIANKKTLDAEPQVASAPAPVETPAPEPEVTPEPAVNTELPPFETVNLPAPVGPIVATPPVPARVDVVEETFTQQGLSGMADIAIVIDDSGSMDLEQNKLSTKLNDLVVALKNANWQIGVVTTTSVTVDGKDKCNLTLIKSTDRDAEKKFLKAVTPGIGGSGNEEGIRQAVNALKCTEMPWVRPNSTVAVLIVSDEDNCSNNGVDCPTSPANSEKYLIHYVEKDLHRVVGKTAGFYGIFAPPAEECSTAKAKGTQYQRLVNYQAGTGVNYGNICDSSYKSTLERISNNIAKLLSSQFILKQTPDDGSLVLQGVKSNGDRIVVADYAVVGNVITFKTGSEPALGSEISLSYKVTTFVTH